MTVNKQRNNNSNNNHEQIKYIFSSKLKIKLFGKHIITNSSEERNIQIIIILRMYFYASSYITKTINS